MQLLTPVLQETFELTRSRYYLAAKIALQIGVYRGIVATSTCLPTKKIESYLIFQTLNMFFEE